MLSTTPLHLLIDRELLEPWRKILLDGADRVEKRGLAKGTLCDDRGRVCVRGGMLNTDGNGRRVYPNVSEADGRLAAWLLRVPYRPHDMPNMVSEWNNAPERTQAEVVDTMRACALDGVTP